MKAAAYARYSTDMQTENSIAYQFIAIKKYCTDKGISIVSYYFDEAQSGTNTDRQGFRNLIANAVLQTFDAVIIYDISRGSRDVADWFEFRKTMSRLNITVIAKTHLAISSTQMTF